MYMDDVMGIGFGIGAVIAVVLTILTFIFIIPEKRRARLNGFFKWVHDLFNFKSLLLEIILKFFYILTTFLCIFAGLMICIMAPFADWGMEEMLPVGLGMLFLGPIITRIAYESFMMFILLVNNTISINRKLSNNSSAKPAAPAPQVIPQPVVRPVAPAPQPIPQPVSPVAPAPQVAPQPVSPVAPAPQPMKAASQFCTKCGAKSEGNSAFCVVCGAKLD